MVIGTECGRSGGLATVSVAQVGGVARGALTRNHFLHDVEKLKMVQNQSIEPDKSTLSSDGDSRYLAVFCGDDWPDTRQGHWRLAAVEAIAGDVKEHDRSEYNHIGDKCQDCGDVIPGQARDDRKIN